MSPSSLSGVSLRMGTVGAVLLLLLLGIAISFLALPAQADTPSNPSAWPERVAVDWVLAERMAALEPVSQPVSTVADAAGGCDGVIDGQWGFHTAEAVEPWWQVDLGQPETIRRVVIWNRPQAPELQLDSISCRLHVSLFPALWMKGVRSTPSSGNWTGLDSRAGRCQGPTSTICHDRPTH